MMANAGVALSTTRLVYKEGMREKAINIGTANQYPVFVQTWVNDGSPESAEQSTSPFISYPPMFTLNPNHVQNVKVVAKTQELLTDRESVFWLNLHEIPPVDHKKSNSQTKITLATTTQLKILYRPRALAELKEAEIIEQQKQIQFDLAKQTASSYLLHVKNTTPYSASFAGLAIEQNGQRYQVKQEIDMMVLPFSAKAFTFEHVQMNADEKLILKYLLIDGEGRSHLQERIFNQMSQVAN